MAINAANVVLVQRVSVLCLRGFEYPRRVAFGCAAFFACHPVHVEAVAGIVGRADLLAHSFGLLAIVVYFRGCGSTYSTPLLVAPVTTVPYGSVIATALLVGSAMLCKETGVCVLAIIAILDVNTICNLEPLQLFPAAAIGANALFFGNNGGNSSALKSNPGEKGGKGKGKGKGKAVAASVASVSSASGTDDSTSPNVIEPAVAAALFARQLLLWALIGVMVVARFRMNRDDIVSVDWSTNPANQMEDNLYRILTKLHYNVLHAALLFWPARLSADYAC